MTGVIIFIAILLMYGIILSHELWSPYFSKRNSFRHAVCSLAKEKKKRKLLSIAAIITGVWNIFAPDFGAMYSPTIIGALVPSVIMIFNGFVLFPEIIDIFNLQMRTRKNFLTKVFHFGTIAGPVTFIAGILHIIFYRSILF